MHSSPYKDPARNQQLTQTTDKLLQWITELMNQDIDQFTMDQLHTHFSTISTTIMDEAMNQLATRGILNLQGSSSRITKAIINTTKIETTNQDRSTAERLQHSICTWIQNTPTFTFTESELKEQFKTIPTSIQHTSLNLLCAKNILTPIQTQRSKRIQSYEYNPHISLHPIKKKKSTPPTTPETELPEIYTANSTLYNTLQHKFIGQGLFTLNALPPATIVGYYKGEAINQEEANYRHSIGKGDKIVKINHSHCLDSYYSADTNTCMMSKANAPRHCTIGINGPRAHPNCKLIIYHKHAYIRTIKSISANTELLLNYGNSFYIPK